MNLYHLSVLALCLITVSVDRADDNVKQNFEEKFVKGEITFEEYKREDLKSKLTNNPVEHFAHFFGLGYIFQKMEKNGCPLDGNFSLTEEYITRREQVAKCRRLMNTLIFLSREIADSIDVAHEVNESNVKI